MVDLGRGPGIEQQRLHFRSKYDVPRSDVVIQRLDADAVAGKHEHLPPRVPDGQREHAGETFDEARSHLFIEVQNDLGV